MPRGIYDRSNVHVTWNHDSNYYKDKIKCTCQYCHNEFYWTGNQLKQHECRCKDNPNSNLRKQYKCKYCGKILNGENTCKGHEVRCHNNPEYNEWAKYSTEELLNIISKYSSRNAVKKDGKGLIFETLNARNIELPKLDNSRPYKNIESKDLIDKIINFNTKAEICKGGLRGVLAELNYRNEVPSKFLGKSQLSDYSFMKADDVFKIAQDKFTDKSREEAEKIDHKLYMWLWKRKKLFWKLFPKDEHYVRHNRDNVINQILINYPGIILPNIDNEYKDKEFKNAKLTCIYNGKTYYGISIGALYHKSTNFNHPFISKEHSNKNKEYKLSLLTKYDLEAMDWSVIIDLIGEDKLPKDFYCLCKFGPNTEGRKEQIKKLKEIYNIETEEEEEVENNADEVIENEVSDIDNYIYNENEDEIFEDELKPYKDIEDIGSLINLTDEEIYSTGDKYQHIFSKEMSKLWGLILRDDENHSTKNIDIIKVKVNDNTITPFSKHIYEEFLKEYEEVLNIQIH